MDTLRHNHKALPRATRREIAVLARVAILGYLLLLLATMAGAQQPDILVIVIDDMGIEYAPGWGVGLDPVAMPNLEALAATGTRYDNFWVDPLCSPTRALLLTGLWGYETGVGTVVQHDDHSLNPQLDTLPEILGAAGYATGLFGKWHLGDQFGAMTPIAHGFDRYEGPLLWKQDKADPSFFDYAWTEVEMGSPPVHTEVVDEHMNGRVNEAAITWILQQSGPWLAVIGSPMAHQPFHFPPGYEPQSNSDPEAFSDRAMYRAMLQSWDDDLAGLLAVAADAHVIVVSDNGSPPEVADPPFDELSAKGTLFQGGIRVPCVIRSPAVPAGVVTDPASAVDLLPTVLSWAGIAAPAGLRGEALPAASGRFVYAERMAPNGVGFAPSVWNIAATDGHYKLVRRVAGGAYEMFYDLDVDPNEQETPLDLAGLAPGEQAAYEVLAAFLDERVDERIAQIQ